MKKPLLAVATLIVLATAGYAWYQRTAAPTRLALVNFMDFQVDRFHQANNVPGTKVVIDTLRLDDQGVFPDISGYDAVLFFAHGNISLTQEDHDTLAAAGDAGVKIHFQSPTPVLDLSTVTAEESRYLTTALQNGSTTNLKRVLNYVRRTLDGKTSGTVAVQPPYMYPDDYFWHLAEDDVYETLADYEAFYRDSGRHTPGGTKVAFISQILGLESGEKFLRPMIEGLEARGMNVYPIAGFDQRLERLEAIDPDLLIFMPHGRLAGDAGVEWLKSQNIPMLSPLAVFAPHDEWQKDQRGMDGGMLTQNVVMPELDGGTTPYVVAAQFKNNRGLNIFEGLPKRIDTFIDLAERYATLRTAPNADKKLAVFYYKGAGKNAMVAEGLEIAPSLLNLLRGLKNDGYTVGDLPADADALHARIQREGQVLGGYAQGTFAQWVNDVGPELVASDLWDRWMKKYFQPEMIAELERDFGPAPGTHMTTVKDGQRHLAVASVQFGNIALIPVPGAGAGQAGNAGEANDAPLSQMAHGVKKAPGYAYLAAYLWAREGFGADALMHFGTHGSVEFTPWKQVALSEYDWPDALFAGIPHFYLYSITNIGEALVAKRRSYATMHTHITPPLMQGEVYGDTEALDDAFEKYWGAQEPALRAAYRDTLHTIIRRAGLEQDLQIQLPDDPQAVDDEQLREVHHYLHDIEQAKVTRGLHVLGRPYSAAAAYETLEQMSLDFLAFSRAELDLVRGNATQAQVDDAHFFEDHYRYPSLEHIKQVFESGAAPQSFLTDRDRAALAAQAQRAAAAKALRAAQQDGHGGGGAMPQDSIHASFIAAEAEANAPDPSTAAELKALNTWMDTLTSIKQHHQAILDSPTLEMKAILNLLRGGYIAPQSGGDPAVNPDALPSGRNLYGINAEATPSPEAWGVAKQLVDQLLTETLARDGRYPNKVAFSLWSSEFVRQEGISIGQILYLLGAEPVRNHRGRVHDVKLIPAEELGRPRIDIVVQTSGQFRDLGASRIYLINKAVALAAAADDASDTLPNRVREGAVAAESLMKERGLSPAEARALSVLRVFGGLNGNYGTGIMGMVENGDTWDDEQQVADTYLNNMGAVYGQERWGEFHPGMFEAALQNTDTVLHPRSSNTWGALSLDHVYEFMGGISLAIKQTTGQEPSTYFSDLRNPTKPVVQDAKKAVWLETRTTTLNPKYIAAMQEEGPSAADAFAETFRNTYGWDVMQSSIIDEAIWDKYEEVYVQDKHGLDMPQFFRDQNPYALQEMTAVMLETHRKGHWNPSAQTLQRVARLHVDLVQEFDAGCSGFVCDNGKLSELIAGLVDPSDPAASAAYTGQITAVRTAPTTPNELTEAQGLTLEEATDQPQDQPDQPTPNGSPASGWIPAAVIAAILAAVAVIALRKRRRVA